MREVFVLGEEDLGELARKVATVLEAKKEGRMSASVVLLEGDLGAGKTTFTKSLAEHLGIDKESVHSPTFILKKEYKTTHPHFKRLVHVDAYRFTHPDEAKVLRLEEDLKDENAVVAVEWPSRMTYLKADVTLSFSVMDEQSREITLAYEED
jgi:tRNA threonylcarbamoyladenosine biosynthesis protein TsaE